MKKKRKCGKGLRKPKHRRSAYVYFVRDYQCYLKQKKGPLSFSESSKLCAAKWKHLPESVKEKYRKMSQEDAKRYKREIEAINPKDLKKLKRKRDPMAPVRPLSAYMWFCKSKWKKLASQNPSLSKTEIISALARLWSESNDKTRKKFEAMAECDKKCYEMEKKKYNQETH